MNSSTIDLQVPPLSAELYAVIDVLVAVGIDLDLARKEGRRAGTDAAQGDARLTREREGLAIALCMLGEIAARQDGEGGRVSSASHVTHPEVKRALANGANDANGDGLVPMPIARLLRRIGGRYLGK